MFCSLPLTFLDWILPILKASGDFYSAWSSRGRFGSCQDGRSDIGTKDKANISSVTLGDRWRWVFGKNRSRNIYKKSNCSYYMPTEQHNGAHLRTQPIQHPLLHGVPPDFVKTQMDWMVRSTSCSIHDPRRWDGTKRKHTILMHGTKNEEGVYPTSKEDD